MPIYGRHLNSGYDACLESTESISVLSSPHILHARLAYHTKMIASLCIDFLNICRLSMCRNRNRI
jgi:hypothetical protein